METDEWAARAFHYLFTHLGFMPDGAGKDRLAKLLHDAPQSVLDDYAELLIEMEQKNGESNR